MDFGINVKGNPTQRCAKRHRYENRSNDLTGLAAKIASLF